MLWVEGRNLLRTGRDSLGEQKLLLASKIVPNRFRYNHELLQLYKRRGGHAQMLCHCRKDTVYASENTVSHSHCNKNGSKESTRLLILSDSKF